MENEFSGRRKEDRFLKEDAQARLEVVMEAQRTNRLVQERIEKKLESFFEGVNQRLNNMERYIHGGEGNIRPVAVRMEEIEKTVNWLKVQIEGDAMLPGHKKRIENLEDEREDKRFRARYVILPILLSLVALLKGYEDILKSVFLKKEEVAIERPKARIVRKRQPIIREEFENE